MAIPRRDIKLLTMAHATMKKMDSHGQIFLKVRRAQCAQKMT